jgi:hypothetical protein
MNTMIDKISRAIAQEITKACAERGGKCASQPDGLLRIEATVDPVLVVRAALEAMLPPSQGMTQAGLIALPGAYDVGEPDFVFSAMIDAALSKAVAVGSDL